jgi:adenylate cyclase
MTGSRIDVSKLAGASSFELQQFIEPADLSKAFDLMDWLLSEARALEAARATRQFCERLIDLGLPLDRYGLSVSMLHAELDAIGRSWVKGKGGY